MRVHVAYVAPGVELCIGIDVEDGVTVNDAVRASRIFDRIGTIAGSPAFAIFGKRVAGDSRVADGDRVEITRPLVCDAKTARRTRAALAIKNAAAGLHTGECARRPSDSVTPAASERDGKD
jgi:uncharacterized protein